MIIIQIILVYLYKPKKNNEFENIKSEKNIEKSIKSLYNNL